MTNLTYTSDHFRVSLRAKSFFLLQSGVLLCVIQSGVCGAKNPGPRAIQSRRCQRYLCPKPARGDKLGTMPRDSLKPIDILRHELKALRYILDNFHSGKLGADGLPPRDDFQSAQGRALYDSIVNSPDRVSAERAIAELELDDVDLDSFLHLSGDHYYTYPALVRERAAAIRTGKLTVEGA